MRRLKNCDYILRYTVANHSSFWIVAYDWRMPGFMLLEAVVVGAKRFTLKGEKEL